MRHGKTLRPVVLGAVTALLILGLAATAWQRLGPRPVTVGVGAFPEQLVYARSADDVVNGGVMFTPPKASARAVAVLWVHGWGANFYSPTYVAIGRALATRGVTTITANTRMHDLATAQQERSGRRIRGGGYWGIPSEQSLDIGAWIDFAEAQGFPKIVLVGHSAGWAATRAYQVVKNDQRVVGLVMASGQVRPASGTADPDLMAQATQLVRDGLGDDLLRLPNRSFPSFVSAATFLDDAKPAPASPDAAPVQSPLLAFFGTRGDVGTEAELEVLKTALDHQEGRPSDVRTVMIHNGDHMYTGEEGQVARVIADWISQIVLPRSVSSTGPGR